MENSLAKPKISKIVINVGLKEALSDKKVLELVSSQLAQISGQKPVITYSRKAIAAFKLREGEPIGLKLTMRGKRMEIFFQKLVQIVLPKVRDFKGVPLSGFDGRGNYTLGIAEIVVFPEIDFAKIDKQSLSADKQSFSSNKTRGLEITIVTTAQNNEEGKKFLEEKGMPFQKEN